MEIDERLRQSAQAVRVRLADEPALEPRAPAGSSRGRGVYLVAAMALVVATVAGLVALTRGDAVKRIGVGPAAGAPGSKCQEADVSGVSVGGSTGTAYCVGMIDKSKLPTVGLATDGKVVTGTEVGVCLGYQGGYGAAENPANATRAFNGWVAPNVKQVRFSQNDGVNSDQLPLVTTKTYAVPGLHGVRAWVLNVPAKITLLQPEMLDAKGTAVSITPTPACARELNKPGRGLPKWVPFCRTVTDLRNANGPKPPQPGTDPEIQRLHRTLISSAPTKALETAVRRVDPMLQSPLRLAAEAQLRKFEPALQTIDAALREHCGLSTAEFGIVLYPPVNGKPSGVITPYQPAVQTLTVESLPSIKFDKTEYVLDRSGLTTVVFNDGGGSHTLHFEGVDGFELAVPGGPTTGEIELKPGTYTIHCGVPGHRAAGEEATVVVR